MKTLIYLVMLFLTQSQLGLAQTENCKKTPVYCKILKLKPQIDKDFATKLASYIKKYSNEFNTDPTVSVAIAMQESSFENKNRLGTISKDGKFVRGPTDVGVFQIHIHTLAYLNAQGADIDLERLEYDVEYQTMWHTKILKSKIRTCKQKRVQLRVQTGNEWSCYHSFTLSKRKLYLRDVSRHLVKLRHQ